MKKADGLKKVVREPLVAKLQPQKEITVVPQKKAEPRKEMESQVSVRESKKEKPIATPPLLSAGKVFRDRLKSGGDGPEMVVVPAGSFQMGDVQGGGDKNEVPDRTVRIQKSFAIGRYEVTFGEYDQFAKAANRQFPVDQGWGRGRRPVIYVSWQEAVEYAKWLSAQTGKRYRPCLMEFTGERIRTSSRTRTEHGYREKSREAPAVDLRDRHRSRYDLRAHDGELWSQPRRLNIRFQKIQSNLHFRRVDIPFLALQDCDFENRQSF